MKTSKFIIVPFLLLMSCGTENSKNTTLTKTDSLLLKSDSAIASVKTSSKNIDSVTTATSEKLNENIDILNKTIDNYRIESQKIKSVTVKEKIVYKRDTIFVETKKNFWGKTKKSVTSVADSSVQLNETVSDSLLNQN